MPGLTNRLLARVVTQRGGDVRVDACASFGGRGFVAGNPVRPEFFDVAARSAADGPPRVLIFGGSQGAHAINVAMVEAAPRLAARSLRAGNHASDGRARSGARQGRLPARRRSTARVEPFLFDMAREMKLADLVVCRVRRDHDRRADGLGAAGDLHPAADRRRRSPARQRRGARGGRRGGGDRAAAADRRAARRRGSRRSPPTTRSARRDVRGGAPARAARRGGARSSSGSLELAETDGAADARPHATDPLRRHRRHRHERHRRAARQPRLRRERLRRSSAPRSPSGSQTLGVRVSLGHAAAQRRAGRRRRRLVGGRRRTTRRWPRRGRAAIPVIPRAEMLAELMRLRYGIAIAGAHGKTTTTSMVALLLEQAGLDPTAVIGGRLSAFGSNARLGKGDYMVAEADESDRSFLKLSPTIAVITNIDREHMESLRHLGGAAAGVRRLRQQGAVLRRGRRVRGRRAGARAAAADHAAGDDLRPARRRCSARTLTVAGPRRARSRRSGRAAPCAIGAAGRQSETLGELRLRVPGRHNLLNALGATAVGLEVGLPLRADCGRRSRSSAARSGASRCAARRRGVMVVDDYGHHPTEIAAVIAAARADRPAAGRRVPAAPLLAHAAADARVRHRACRAPTRSC